MIVDTINTKVFLYRDFVDMRKGHNGLSFIVTHQMDMDLLSGAIFLFVARNRKATKALVWDGTGLILIHKKLETGKLMSFDNLKQVQEITSVELALIMEGNKIKIPLSKKKLKIELKV